MQFRKALYTFGITGSLLFLVIIFAVSFSALVPKNLASLLAQPSVALPVRLKIPKIKLNTVLEYVSVTSDGTLGVPKDIDRAAWFALGPRPGQEGNAIIDGHFGFKNGQPAIFNNLYTLRPGDKIYVEDQAGNTTTFVVRQLRIYDKNEDASGIFGLSDNGAHLNLITCQGSWINNLKTYSNRLVVFADKE